MTTEPRTEAGRALLGWARMANPYRPHRADEIRDAILAIETEAAAGPRDWGKGYVPGTGANEAAAGPRDEGGTLTRCSIEGVHEHAFRGPHRFREWDPDADAPTEPRDYKRGPCVHGNPCRESMCVEYGRSEATAGPRDEGLRKAVVLALADLRHAGGGPRVDAAYERLSAALVKASE